MVCGLAVSGCVNEDFHGLLGLPDGALLLQSERYSGHNKTSVSGRTVQWDGGEQVLLNGSAYDVVISGDRAYVNGSALSGPVVGYYPADIVGEGGEVMMPQVYYSRYANDGHQVLALPMVAWGDANDGALEFRHLTAAVKVLVKNSTGFDLTLDSVVVHSTYPLSGTVVPDFAAANLGITAGTAGEDNRVKVRFSDSPVIAVDAIREVQVPVLPVGEGDLTVKVYTHSKVPVVVGQEGLCNANYDFNYSHSAASPALGRNVLLEARVELKRASESTKMTEVDHSLFTVDISGRKVRFSKGNLQYTTYRDNPWAFQQPWECCFPWNATNSHLQNSGYGDGISGPIDLFAWGTSGWAGGCGDRTWSAYRWRPWEVGTKFSSHDPISGDCYGPDGDHDLTGAYADFDRAWHNPIANGGNQTHQWRTLTMEEWRRLFHQSRRTKMAGATVEGQYKGVVLLPDNWTLPEGLSFSRGPRVLPSMRPQTNTYSSEDWERMEAAGAVFLVYTGELNARSVSTRLEISGYGTVFSYETSTAYPGDNSSRYVARFQENQGTFDFVVSEPLSRATGVASRPVQDVVE